MTNPGAPTARRLTARALGLCALLLLWGMPARAQIPGEIHNPHPYGTAEYTAFTLFVENHVAVLATYREIADTFNRRFAGRYPFGPLDAPDASRHDVCAFYARHTPEIVAVRSALAPRGEFKDEVDFLVRLDTVGVFLAGTACARFNPPIRIALRPEETEPVSSKPHRIWTLTDGFGRARVPHGAPTLDWRFGAPLALAVTWTEHAGLRPRRATAVDRFETPDSATISYRMQGDWALMRFVETYRDSFGWRRNDDSSGVMLRFRAPLMPILKPSDGSAAPRHESMVSLNVALHFEHYAPGKPRLPLRWPRRFPVTAPVR